MSQQEFKNSPEYKLWIKETGGHINEKNYYREQFANRIASEEAQTPADKSAQKPDEK